MDAVSQMEEVRNKRIEVCSYLEFGSLTRSGLLKERLHSGVAVEIREVVSGQIVRPTVPIAPASRQVTPGSAVLSPQMLPSQGVSTTQQQAPSQPTSLAMAFTSGQSAPPTPHHASVFCPICASYPHSVPPGTLISAAPGGSRVVHAMLPPSYFLKIAATEALSRTRKPCNCTKSQCLKLYCECFSNGEFCSTCNCRNCFNNLAHEVERQRAIKSCLGRNPEAFRPKIGKGKEGEAERRHNKGCHCKRSGCLKNYCECYEAKIMCSSMCKCVGCKNMEDSPERKTLMHLADAAEVRVQQQAAARTKLSQISDLPARTPHIPGTQRLPFSFVTREVAEATCGCLMAQAEDAERRGLPPEASERLVLEEFQRCLLHIIQAAGKVKGELDCKRTTSARDRKGKRK
uniref:protein lin-54 homolog n=1 Tax=Myxine glutinosa TaxID=7769 RepID=UPI00358EA0D5